MIVRHPDGTVSEYVSREETASTNAVSEGERGTGGA
jgi:hypothetical protein